MTAATPLERADERLAGRSDVYLKREDVHELGAFKWRGALPALRAFKDRGATAVVTASTGNHGAATAWAAAQLGLRAVVFAPEGASATKLAHIERSGPELRIEGATFDDAKDAAEAYAATVGAPYFVDGAEPSQFDGYRAIAREIVTELGEPPAAEVVPVGNGALLGGIGLELRDHTPETLRVGVQSTGAPVMVECWRAGRIVETDKAETFADGLAARVAVPYAVDVLATVASRMLLVSDRAIARAVGAYANVGIRAEGAAGAALAALAQLDDVSGPVVLIVTGRNIDDELWRRACDAPDSFPD